MESSKGVPRLRPEPVLRNLRGNRAVAGPEAKLDEDFVSDPKNGFTCSNYPECDECLRQSYDKDEIDPDCVED